MNSIMRTRLNVFLIICSLISCHSNELDPIVQPKFGDRIGKLKRNFQRNENFNDTKIKFIPTWTTTTSSQSPPTRPIVTMTDTNHIKRSDDYIETDDYENKKYFVIKHQSDNDRHLIATNNESQMATNQSFQIQPAPSSSLVQARLEMLTDFFDVPPSPMSSVYSTPGRASNTSRTGVVLATKNYIQPTNSTFVRPTTHYVEHFGLRNEPWVMPILVLSCLAMFMMASFEIFVLCKTRRALPNRRHLFLGQMLLLGLFSCAGLSALLTARPSSLSCASIRFGAGVSFTIVFASLLVKCIFLISLNGGVYLPAPYQGLLLLFAVLIQITIGIQWLVTMPPGITFISSIRDASLNNRLVLTAESINSMRYTIQLCRTSFSEMLLSLIYVVFLIIFVTILAIKSRGIRENYREATYIGLAISGVIPIWLGWTLCGLAVSERHKDACLAFGLLATSSIVFLVMFMPKGRQLAAMGREDMYVEDREERLSSASSRAGSGYSPSFFHFKPLKYGMMNGKGNGGNTNERNNHQQAVTTLTLGGGEFLIYLLRK